MRAQTDSTYIDFSAYVHLDSIMISASREGFSVEEFIKIIQEDRSLEESFNNMRKISYTYSNEVKFFKNNGNLKASHTSKNHQHFEETCQWMEVLESHDFGNYEKFYTTDFYKRVFYKPLLPCKKEDEPKKVKRTARILEKRIVELKKLIYTPGQEASVPLIGGKTAIFSEKMLGNYDFSIEAKEESYLFTARIKPHYNHHNPNGSVVKYLEIEMKKETFQVMSRNYKLQYNAGVYHFDIVMKVDLIQNKNLYIPSRISYDGFWKVVGKPKENCKFEFQLIEIFES